MSGTSFITFTLLILLSWAGLRFARWAYGDYFAPIGLFVGVNLASLALNQLSLLPFAPLSTEALLLVVLALFSFVVGAFIATPPLIVGGKRLHQRRFFGEKDLAVSDGLNAFFYFTALLGLAGWVFLVTVVVPPGWLSNLWMLQGDYVFPYHLGYSLVASALVTPAFVLLALTKRRIGFPAVCLLVGNLVALAVCGIKSYLFLSVSTALLVWSIVRPGRIRLRHLLFLGAVLVGFFVFYDRFIDIFVPSRFPGSKFPSVLSFLERPYLYAAGPWSAMSVVMANPPPQAHWGQVTLLVVWKILGPGGLGLMERVPKYFPFVDIGPSIFNTYSLIGEVYWDFGWLGAILICFSLGFISTTLYLRARKHRDWITCLLSAVFSYGLLFSFFAYYYRDNLIFLLLYTVVVGKLAKQWSRAWRHFTYLVGRQYAMVKADTLGGSR